MPRIGTKALAQMLRRVGTSVRAGLDIRTIWQTEMHSGSPTHRQQASIVSGKIAAGDTLAEALSSCGGYFPTLTCDLVEVGEKTGRLDEVVLGLAEHYEHLLSLRRTFLIGIFWPAIELAAAIVIVGLLILIMGVIGATSGGEPFRILGFEAGTKGFITYIFFITAVVGVFAWLLIAVRRGWFGPKPMELAMRIPVIGRCLQTAALSRLAWTLSLTLNAGMDAKRSIKLALRSTQNAYYTSQLAAVDSAVGLGREFHDALRGTGVFPDEFLSSLETAELSGTHTESLGRLAEDYRDRAKATARTLTVVAGIAVWILVALIIIVVIFQFFMTLYWAPYREAMDFWEESQ